EHRRLLVRPGFWVMTAVAAACCLPILVWNAQHGWVSFWHVNRLAGLRGAAGLRWDGPLVYVGGQCGRLLGVWLAAWAVGRIAHHPWREGDLGRRFLWWLSAPVFVVFLLFSPKTGGGEPNWPVTAYIAGLVLAAGWVADLLASPRWRRRAVV